MNEGEGEKGEEVDRFKVDLTALKRVNPNQLLCAEWVLILNKWFMIETQLCSL